MEYDKNKIHNFKFSVFISPTYLIPLFFKDKKESFQWAKTSTVPLKKLVGNNKSIKKELDDAFEFNYNILATSKDDAINQSIEIINFILNIASFHYSIGLIIKSPVSIINVDTKEGISYDFHRIEITQKDFCTKIIDVYLPVSVKDNKGAFKLSSDEILTYEPSEIFKTDDFYKTIDFFKSFYFDYIKDQKLKTRIEFSLSILKETLQIPSFISRFILYWRAFKELVNSDTKSGAVNQESIDSILDILKKQECPKLSATDLKRVKEQICNVHQKSKTNLIINEMEKYFDESEYEIRKIYTKLNKTRQKIIHSDYKGEDVFELWADTDLLKSIIKQIIKVHFKYPKAKFRKQHFKRVLHIKEAARPKI